MNDLTYVIDPDFPVTICPPMPAHGVCAPRKTKPKVGEARKAQTTRSDLAALCVARGLKVTTKHVKAELAQMLATGEYVRPAALDRENARRKAKRQA